MWILPCVTQQRTTKLDTKDTDLRPTRLTVSKCSTHLNESYYKVLLYVQGKGQFGPLSVWKNRDLRTYIYLEGLPAPVNTLVNRAIWSSEYLYLNSSIGSIKFTTSGDILALHIKNYIIMYPNTFIQRERLPGAVKFMGYSGFLEDSDSLILLACHSNDPLRPIRVELFLEVTK